MSRFRVVLLGAIVLAVLLIFPRIARPEYYRVTFGKGHVTLETLDDEGNRTRGAQVICSFCHQANKTLADALAKPYDAQSKQNHQNKYFQEKSLKIAGMTRHMLDEDVYLAREGSRLVLVHPRDNYKLTFAQDAIVLLDNKGKPAFIHSFEKAIKAKLGPMSDPIKK